MSTNNQLLITKDFVVYDQDVDTGDKQFVKGCGTLEEDIKAANDYQIMNTVEYGLQIESED